MTLNLRMGLLLLRKLNDKQLLLTILMSLHIKTSERIII